MTLDQFTQQVRRQPFRPFQLVMVDGSRFTVDHPEFVSTAGVERSHFMGPTTRGMSLTRSSSRMSWL
ncbi:MAG: hypothetical protein WB773_01790 [Isosphaeraceae bacterium]